MQLGGAAGGRCSLSSSVGSLPQLLPLAPPPRRAALCTPSHTSCDFGALASRRALSLGAGGPNPTLARCSLSAPPRPEGLLAEQEPSLPPPPPSGGPDNEYFLQVGVAIRTLRDDFPALFERDPDFSLFRDDIAFVDRVGLPGAPASAAGLEAYRRVFWQLRLHRSLFFSRATVSILRIWQPRERTLAVRWSVAAAPRLLASLGAGDVHWDGISWYKLDSKGRIYEHVLDNVDWGDPPLARNSLSSILSGFAQPAQPTPSFFLGWALSL